MKTDTPMNPQCNKCRAPMRPGFAIPPAIVEMDEGTMTEGAHVNRVPLATVWKCPKCGHSFKP